MCIDCLKIIRHAKKSLRSVYIRTLRMTCKLVKNKCCKYSMGSYVFCCLYYTYLDVSDSRERERQVILIVFQLERHNNS